MENYPQEVREREELNLRQGIKSSLPRLEQLFAVVISLYLAFDEASEVEFSRQKGNKIILSAEAEDKISAFFAGIYDDEAERQKFVSSINASPLFTIQMEPLQVALEIFWKLGKIGFLNEKFPDSKERTGGIRYEKRLRYSTNAQIFSVAFKDSITSLKEFLFSIITNVEYKISNDIPDRISELLTIFTEEAQYKLRKSDSSELYFQQEGVYEGLENENKIIDIKDAHESVGPLRILKSFLNSGLHAYLYESEKNKIALKQKKSIEQLRKYKNKVSTFLDLQPRKTTIIETLLEPTEPIVPSIPFPHPRQKIFYGAPGTGKSYRIKQLREEYNLKEFKTVFHPDSDYASFVGTFKPKTTDGKISYAFVPQVFTKAYLYAWQNPQENVLLTIEEINRGNCAQIFGDLFQSLDRDAEGFSEYAVEAETDLADYLQAHTEGTPYMHDVFAAKYETERFFEKIALPPNLYIYATMNTSDQSLYPMDSAFKRRWDWEYVPIDYEKAKETYIELDGATRYNWGDFIENINAKILAVTQSEDKQLGNYFVKTATDTPIPFTVFRGKVLFYLWSEVFKDENETETIFKYENAEGELTTFAYSRLYQSDATEILRGFMQYNKIETV